jgi:IS30 family transposase
MSGGTHLELEERERLAVLKAEGLSLRAIARALGRAASTVSRELRRNALVPSSPPATARPTAAAVERVAELMGDKLD